MPRPLLIVNQSDYLIQIFDINSHSDWQTVQIQISWLLQKPTDLDLHCLQRQGMSRFSRTKVKLLLFEITLEIIWIGKAKTTIYTQNIKEVFYLTKVYHKISQVHSTTCWFFWKNCWMGGKQCRPWSDAAFCGIWSGTTLFAQVLLSQY